MPPRKWDLRIRDILASIERIIEYTRNLDFEQFRSDTKTFDAVVRNFEIIGEAAAHGKYWRMYNELEAKQSRNHLKRSLKKSFKSVSNANIR